MIVKLERNRLTEGRVRRPARLKQVRVWIIANRAEEKKSVFGASVLHGKQVLLRKLSYLRKKFPKESAESFALDI